MEIANPIYTWVDYGTAGTALLAGIVGLFIRHARRPEARPALDVKCVTADILKGATLFPFIAIVSSVVWPQALSDVIQSQSIMMAIAGLVALLSGISDIISQDVHRARPERRD